MNVGDMTKEEYIKKSDNIRNQIIEKYGTMAYYLISDIFNISYMESVCEKIGYKTSRKRIQTTLYSKLFDENNKEIGVISNQGCPTIEIYKRNKKHAIKISKDKNVIDPIDGVHRVLSWHSVEGKLHKLAGGEIVLHFIPVEIPDDDIQDFIENKKMKELFEYMKKSDDVIK